MSFHTGTINSAAPTADLLAALTTHIDSHAAWEYVEEVVGATYTHRVFRCLGSQNGFGTDFYVGLRRQTLLATSVIEMAIFEEWNTSTKVAGKFATAPASTSAISVAADMTIGSTTRALDYQSAYPMVGWWSVLNTTIQNVAFTYWLSVSPQRLVMNARINALDWGGYVGLYESFHSTAIDIFPLVTGVFGSWGESTSSSGTFGGFTREAGETAGATSSGQLFNLSVLTQWTNYISGQMENLSGAYLLTRSVVKSRRNTTRYRGMFRDLWFCALSGVTPVGGDTLTVGGVLYTYVGYNYWVPQSA